MFYIAKDDKIIIFNENKQTIINTIEQLPEYKDLEIKETNRPIVDYEFADTEEYKEKQAKKERERLDALTLTPADVERALYKEKGMDFEDLKALIAQQLPQVDIKGLSIEFRAKDFFRGAEANGMRLFDVVGALLGYTPQDMDYLFENKELPVKEEEENEN